MPYNHACANGSSAVGDCLHTYLERDFSSIEAIIYAKKRGFAIYEYLLKKIKIKFLIWFNGFSHKDSVLLLDGPELADQCK